MALPHEIAIYLADTEQARRLAHGLESETVVPFVAGHSEELFEILGSRRVDIVVIQNELRGFLNGIEIVERLFDDLIRPKVILLAKQTPELQRLTARLGVQTILAPASSAADIADAVTGLLASGVKHQISIPLGARRLVRNCGDISPLPQLVIKLASCLNVETVSIPELAREIAVDPQITAGLLRLANSTVFGVRNKFTKVQDAVSFLGVKRTAALILSASLMNTQRSLCRRVPEEFRAWYNRRSTLIASTAATFARNLNGISADEAYVLGLLQDIGILVLASEYGIRYCRLIERVREIGQLRLANVERQEFKLTHAAVSAALIERWGLPSSFATLVAEHHDTGSGTERAAIDNAYLHVLRVGEAVADVSDVCQPQRLKALDQLLSHYGPARVVQVKSALAESVAKAAEVEQLFSVRYPSRAGYDELVRRVCDDHGDLPSDPADVPKDLNDVAKVAHFHTSHDSSPIPLPIQDKYDAKNADLPYAVRHTL